MMTTLPLDTWEPALLSLAHEERLSRVVSLPKPVADRALLDRAYAYCDSITAAHSRSFYLATALLPADKRRAIRALYAFCHVSDNLVDCPERDAEKALAAWRGKALSPEPPMSDLVAMA